MQRAQVPDKAAPVCDNEWRKIRISHHEGKFFCSELRMIYRQKPANGENVPATHKMHVEESLAPGMERGEIKQLLSWLIDEKQSHGILTCQKIKSRTMSLAWSGWVCSFLTQKTVRRGRRAYLPIHQRIVNARKKRTAWKLNDRIIQPWQIQVCFENKKCRLVWADQVRMNTSQPRSQCR